MRSRIVSICTALAVMAVVLGLAGCPADSKDESGIPVTGISLTKSSLELPLGDNWEKLEYTIIPENATNQQVRWSSDDDSIASVSQDGTVFFHIQGETIVTATTVDGGFTDTITITVGPSQPVTGINLEKDDLTLTMFAKEILNYTFVPATASNKKVTWVSSHPAVASVASNGTVTALSYTTGGTSTDSSAATGTATITVTTADGEFTDTITITTTMEGQVDIMDLPPLKDLFDGYLIIGNIFDPGYPPYFPGDISAEVPYVVTNERLLRHYNVLTPQNNMKPSYMSTATRGQYNENYIATADRMVNAARASGFKVVGHTLLWHSQNAAWMNNLRTDDTSAADALVWMKEYVTYIVKHFKGRIYIWDILNEAFPDSGYTADWKTSIRSGSDGNPWFMKIGSDFVYEGFLAARLADPNAVLYYNDYSLNNAAKATLVRDMVRDVNDRYMAAYPNASRLLIEGIGMQSHHNTGVTAISVKATLDLFRPLGVRISISEMDVLSQSWNDHDSGKTPTNAGKLQAANLYGEYFKLFIQNADMIERVSFWGVSDDRSWRRISLPQLFDANGKAKPAYYKVIGTFQ